MNNPMLKIILFLLLFCGWQNVVRAQHIVIFGDSITNGYQIPPGQPDWVDDFMAQAPKSYTDTVLALNGSTLEINPVDGPSFQTAESSGITANANAYASVGNIFIIMLGTNDAKTDNEANDNLNFVNDYKTLLDKITSNGTKHPSIYITTPPPIANGNIWGMDPTYANGTLSNMILGLSGYDGANVINLSGDLHNAFTQNQALYLTANDGAHPTVAGDQLIADDIYQNVFVPEPSTFGLLTIGVLGMTWFLAFRRRNLRA